MSVIAKVVSASSGTARMSRISRRVNPIDPAPIIAIFNAMGGILSAMADFDKLWNYHDPAGTEQKFRELLPAAEAGGDNAYLAELLTQIARTHSLRRQFDESHRILDRVEAMLTPDMKLPRVRYLLERGRAFRSAGEPERSIPFFEQAWKLGEANLPRYAIDAVHMIAIAKSDPKEQVEWNLRGIEMVEKDPTQRGWLYSLYNNLGEAYALLGEYAKGLQAFQNMAQLDIDKGNEPELYTLKDQSRMLRALGRLDDAMVVLQQALDRLAREKKEDGWISEEHGEILLAQGKPDAARAHFAIAYKHFSKDPWVVKNEPAKIEHLRKLSF
jgi:tetratricopeptide (TPR) repeat protein